MLNKYFFYTINIFFFISSICSDKDLDFSAYINADGEVELSKTDINNLSQLFPDLDFAFEQLKKQIEMSLQERSLIKDAIIASAEKDLSKRYLNAEQTILKFRLQGLAKLNEEEKNEYRKMVKENNQAFQQIINSAPDILKKRFNDKLKEIEALIIKEKVLEILINNKGQ